MLFPIGSIVENQFSQSSLNNFSWNSGDSRIPGLPGCSLRDFRGFFTCRLYLLDQEFG